MGALKEALKPLLREWLLKHPEEQRTAEMQLNPFLVASLLFGVWQWNDDCGLYKPRKTTRTGEDATVP